MSFSTYHTFRGEINNLNINNIYGKIDYDLNNTLDRKYNVEKILEEFDDFFTPYFSEHFKVELNKDDESLSNNNVCKMLEVLASYLLTEFGNKKRNIIYNFYTDEEKFKKALKANVVEDLAALEIEGEVTSLDILVQHKNYRVVKKYEVNSKDLNEEGLLGTTLKEYEEFRVFLKQLLHDMLHNSKKIENVSPYKIRRLLAEIKDDMNLTKEKINKPINLSGSMSENIVDWSCVDFNNPKHIEALIYFKKINPSPYSELSIIIYDFYKNVELLYKKNILKINDIRLMKLLQEGCTYDEIAKVFGLGGKSSIHKRISLLCKKISKNVKN